MTLFGTEKWSERSLDLLRECVMARKSAGQTARHMTTELGRVFTRGAVIGKAKRLGLKFDGAPKNGHDTTPKREKMARSRRKAKPVEGFARNVRADVPAMDEPLALGDVATGCRWLHGDALERNFCGAARYLESRYCAHHFARVYRQAPPSGAKKNEKIRADVARRFA
jgi:hypothetical protein